MYSRRYSAQQSVNIGRLGASIPVAACTYDVEDLGDDAEIHGRMESFHQKLLTTDDKIVNLTKLLKLTQSLQDEREQELRKELEECRLRYRKLESMNARLLNELDEVRGSVIRIRDEQRSTTETVRSTIAQMQSEEFAGVSHKIAAVQREISEVRLSVDHRLRETVDDTSRQIQQWTQSLSDRFHAETSQRVLEVQSSLHQNVATVSETVMTKISQVQRELTTTTEQVQRQSDSSRDFDRALTHLRQQMEQFTTSQCTLVEESLVSKTKSLQEQIQHVHASMSEYVHNYKEHVVQNTEKTNEIYEAMKQLVEVHETTRSVLSGDLEAIKDWMGKTTHRLKGKLEILATEVKSVREDHIKMMGEMLKTRSGVPAKDSIIEILSAKSSEANMLATKVDDEIKKVARSRSVPVVQASHNPVTSVTTTTRTAETVSQFSTDSFLEKSKARRQQLDEMCADLATLDQSLTRSQRSSTK